MTVTLDVTEGLATITLARPTAHNALDVVTKKAFLEAVESVAQDANVRAVLLTAEGKNFCVGQDLGDHVAALEADPATAMATVAEHYNPLIRALSSLRVPVVVAIPGACVGAGWGIALTGDILIAGQRTSFATAFTGIGLASDSGLSHSLVQSLGASRASALLLLGDKVTAGQALDWGLVHQVVADDKVQAVALETAQRFAAGPSAAYRYVKSLVAASAGDLDAALRREQDAQVALGQTDDHKSAVDAFLAKKRPVFVGH
ncbi:enoyl-CoA hydratase/isomerase family protein [Gordonia rubripertincta]|uniref:enoyl-CoA hydratase/isomerase family protein n=1 Tax=Gordonia rubripertincta TaxID=36822 RepID=UPI000B8D339A|nr:enoyl-CoA hydratase-related protein [Gordonia rubripertincta]ASR05563.1 1,2-epoxyphenylacetyl-CoA isomerase [Gordonia rubripertincta]